jgi:ribonucleoside-triphosphate reductase
MNQKYIAEKIDSIVETRKVPVELYSRIAGYYRPVRQWNLGKQEEYKDRKEYLIPTN